MIVCKATTAGVCLRQASLRNDHEADAEIDVSLEASHVCIVDGDGKIIREAKVLSEPEALIDWFRMALEASSDP